MAMLPCPFCGSLSIEQIGATGIARKIALVFCATCSAIYPEATSADDERRKAPHGAARDSSDDPSSGSPDA